MDSTSNKERNKIQQRICNKHPLSNDIKERRPTHPTNPFAFLHITQRMVKRRMKPLLNLPVSESLCPLSSDLRRRFRPFRMSSPVAMNPHTTT